MPISDARGGQKGSIALACLYLFPFSSKLACGKYRGNVLFTYLPTYLPT